MFQIIWPLLAALGGWFGSYAGSYMKTKGENRAIHEDLDKLVKQMEATTSATKAIEARISNQVWDRQKQWEMKREALFAALQALEHADDALMGMALAYANMRKNGEQSESEWLRTTRERTDLWHEAMKNYDDKCVIARLACDRPSVEALRTAGKVMRLNASKLFNGVINGYDDMGTEVQRQIVNAFALARKELGVDSN